MKVMDLMFDPSKAPSKKKKCIALLAVLGVAAAVGTLLLGLGAADLFAFVGGRGDSNFHHRQLKKEEDMVKARELLWKNQPLPNFIDPSTIIYKTNHEEQHEFINKAVADGSTYFQVHQDGRWDISRIPARRNHDRGSQSQTELHLQRDC